MACEIIRWYFGFLRDIDSLLSVHSNEVAFSDLGELLLGLRASDEGLRQLTHILAVQVESGNGSFDGLTGLRVAVEDVARRAQRYIFVLGIHQAVDSLSRLPTHESDHLRQGYRLIIYGLLDLAENRVNLYIPRR